MATIVSNTKTQPAILMDKLHVDTFFMENSRDQSAKTKITAVGMLYGVDGNGDKVFDKEQMGISDDDFDAMVVQKEVEAGGTVEGFMTKYAAAKAQVAAELANGELPNELLMAYFEAALGRIFEIYGKATISSVE